jgi:NEDD8-activating enzyme E1 regulatory subunit
LKKFYKKFGYLPLSGKIPDMESETNNYVSLQKIVKKHSREEMRFIKKHSQLELEKLGLDRDRISDLDYKEFSTHAYYLRVFDHGSLEDELNIEKVNMEMIREELQNPSSLIIWYFLLRASDNFYVKHKHWPGNKIFNIRG